MRGRRVDALAALDLDIRAGEFFCIVGPSRLRQDDVAAHSRRVSRPVGGLDRMVRDRRGDDARGTATARPLNSMVFQEHSIFPWMTVRNNVAFGLKARGLSRRDATRIADPTSARSGSAGSRTPCPTSSRAA